MYKEYASKQFVEEYFKNQNISSVSTPDWNENDESSSSYIKNRPFYNKTQYTKKYEVDITFTDSRTVSDLDLWINEGNFYRIEFNGEAFEAVGVELGFFHNKVGDVNNNPIEIECYEVIAEGSGRYCWVKLSDNYELGTYSLVVYEGIPDVKKIEQQYLPENIVYFSEDEENGTDVPNEDNTLLAEIEALKAQIPLNIQFWWDYNYDAEVECGKNVSFNEIYSALENGRPIIAMLKIFNSAYDNNLENIEYWQLLISGIHNEFDDNDNVINTYIEFIDQTPSRGSYHLIYLDKNDVLSVGENNG